MEGGGRAGEPPESEGTSPSGGSTGPTGARPAHTDVDARWLARRGHGARPVCLQRQKPPRPGRSPVASPRQTELAGVPSWDGPCQVG